MRAKPVVISLFFFCLTIGVAISRTNDTERTIERTVWEQSQWCEKGDDNEKYVVTRYYDNGDIEMKWVWRACDEECWEETPWGSTTTLPTLEFPVTVDNGGNMTLHQVPLGDGGMFTEGSGPTCRGFVSNPMSTTIFIPASMANDLSFQ